WRWGLIFAPLLLVGGIIVELNTVPAPAWATRLIGRNAFHCVSLIPLLSFPPVACLLATMRNSAPMYPMLAGATVGVASSGVGALLYALTCPDDSPLFVATWYSTAITIVTAVSAYIGRRMLRW